MSGNRKNRLENKKEEMVQYELVLKARTKSNPLEEIPSFISFTRNCVTADIVFKRISDVDKDTLDWILDLEKRNMESIYNSCSWGWNSKKKENEMTESDANYLIATVDSRPVAFTHFRFDMDFGDAVLYCYELQIEEKFRRNGIGKFMLQCLEMLAFKNNMKKVILTVLKHNKPAVDFFYAMKYKYDETNPVESIFEQIPYEILSKAIKKIYN